MSDADLLGKLPLIAATSEQVDDFFRDWIKLIRSRNISWAEIGKVLGISRQAAWERFREVADDGDGRRPPDGCCSHDFGLSASYAGGTPRRAATARTPPPGCGSGRGS